MIAILLVVLIGIGVAIVAHLRRIIDILYLIAAQGSARRGWKKEE